MELGERFSHEGREYVYLGADPMGVPEQRAYLEDVKTKERRTAPLKHLLGPPFTSPSSGPVADHAKRPQARTRGVPVTAATVIVADDDAGVRFVCALNLELEGYRVLEASNAREVRQRLAEASDAIVLLDSRLGADDGIALGQELREKRPDLPIALVTGDTRADDAEARALTGHVIGKPFALEDLVGTVRTLAGR